MARAPRPLAGVFFDLYGTLLLYGDMDRAWADWLEGLHRALTPAGLSMGLDDLGRACEGMFSAPEPPPEGGLTIYERRLAAFARRLGLEVDGHALVEAVEGTVPAWQRYVTLDPEAPPLLRRLGRTHRLALITNFDHPPHVHGILDELDLRRFFEAIVISGEVGVTKPDPRVFAPALEATGLDAAEVAYVGDAPEDAEAARAAGMLPILVRREGAVQAAAVNDYNAQPMNEHPAPETADGVVVIRDLAELDQRLP